MIRILVLFSFLILQNLAFTQKEANADTNKLEAKTASRIKVSGYIQAQFQYGEKDALLKVGAPNSDLNSDFNRIGIRRGRVKLQYEKGIGLGVFQVDITEKGVGLKDAYIKITDPWFGSSSIQVGVFNRPFGYEVGYSSSNRESPERAMINQTLFPDERDLGLMATFQAKKTSSWSFLKLDVGLFAGNGVRMETDNRKDFIGHLSFKKQLKEKVSISGGISYYNGGVYQGTENVYSISDKSFVLNSQIANKGSFARREYFGLDAQFSFHTIVGKTKLYGEYIFGTQPGVELNSKSPNAATVPSSDTYLRSISGGYLTFVQSLGNLPLSLVAKYEWYDPNTIISKNDIGFNGTSVGDISFQTTGFGLLWQIDEQLRLQTYYEFVLNERTDNLPDYSRDLKDNTFTVRLQFKF